MFKSFIHSRWSWRLKALKITALCGFFLISVCFSAPPNIKHTMLISGTGLNYVGIIDTTGKVVWKHVELESANGQKNDCWLLPNGNVIYSYQYGVRIVNIRTNQVIWDRPTPKRNNQSGETHSCQPLENGSKFLIPECFMDTAFIVEVDTAKKELRRIALKNQGGGTHGKWRQIRKTPQNTYLVSSYDLHHSFEYDTSGQLIHDFPSGGYVAVRLENGNTLTGTGDDCRFVEYNAGGTQVWEVNNSTASVSGLGIGFASEMQRLANGNTIITNWGGHGTGYGAAVVEIKPDRTLAGAIPDSFPTQIASVKIIDGWSLPVETRNNELRRRSAIDKPSITVTAAGRITISIPYFGKTDMKIFDCNGRKIIEHTYPKAGPYILKDLVPGVYTILLRSSNTGKRWSKVITVK
jgi:hypothetical protein